MSGRSTETSLRCLAHPATLSSIAILLLNDHVLKRAMPSLLTGKLSDLAGVFFFPFLLAALLSHALERWARPRPATVGLVAMGVTGAWFALLKVSPVANAWTCSLLSALWGGQVVLLLDPTDLVALVMLWPAWRLWQRESARVERTMPPRLAWAALAVAVAATVATSPVNDELVLRIVNDNQEVYALTKFVAVVAGENPTDEREWMAYRSADNGRSWTAVEEIPAAVLSALAREPVAVAAGPTNPATQFRLSGQGAVEQSADGGQTWQAAWSVPSGRDRFIMRAKHGRGYDPGPYDLAFTPDGSGTLIVAAGTEGVLVRDPSGAWAGYEVGRAAPTPSATSEPRLWMALLGAEFLTSMALASLAAIGLTVYGLEPLVVAVDLRLGYRMAWWVRRPGLLGGVAGALVWVLLWAASWFEFPLSLAGVSFFITLVLALYWSWHRALSLAGWPAAPRAARREWLVAMGMLLLAGTAPWVLWAVGVIPWYGAAVALAALGGLLIVGLAAWRVRQYTRIGQAG